MLALYNALPAAGAAVRAEVHAGARLLGRVLRDDRVLAALLDVLPAGEAPVGRAIHVARALLGTAPPSPHPVGSGIPADSRLEEGDLPAHLTALGASLLDEAQLMQRLVRLQATLPPWSEVALSTAIRRLRLGMRLNLA